MRIFFIISLIIYFVSVLNVSYASNFQRGETFDATISYDGFDKYRVDLSLVPGLNWIKTIACIEIIIFEDVLIEPWYSGNEIAGGFFYIKDDYSPKEDWESCQITGFYSYEPE